MRPRQRNDYNSMSPNGKSLANRAKRAFMKDHPDADVKIDGRMGWIMVNDKKAVNLSQASSRAMTLEDVLAKMEQTYLGSPIQENKMRITESKLRRIIRKTLREGAYEKLNSDATGDSSNLDQELYFDLAREVEAICEKYATDPRFAQYGINEADVLEELKIVIQEIE